MAILRADILLRPIDEENKKFIEAKRQSASAATSAGHAPAQHQTQPGAVPPLAGLMRADSAANLTTLVPAVLDALAGDEPSGAG